MVFFKDEYQYRSRSQDERVKSGGPVCSNTPLIQSLGYGPDEEPTGPAMGDWNEFNNRMRSSPLECKVKDATGQFYVLDLVLHNMNKPMPMSIVTTLLEQTPQAMKEKHLYDNAFNNYNQDSTEAEDIMRTLYEFYLMKKKPSKKLEIMKVKEFISRAIENGNYAAFSVFRKRYPEIIGEDADKNILLHQVCSTCFKLGFDAEIRDKMLGVLLNEGIRQELGGKLGVGGLLHGIGSKQTPFQLALETIQESVMDSGGHDMSNEGQILLWKSFDSLKQMVDASRGIKSSIQNMIGDFGNKITSFFDSPSTQPQKKKVEFDVIQKKKSFTQEFPYLHHLLGYAGELIQFIIERYNIDLSVVDDNGRNILMQIIDEQKAHPSYRISTEGTQCFVHLLRLNETARKCASQQDIEGKFLLHYALNHCDDQGWTWETGLKQIYCIHPQALFVSDSLGRLPLHMALDSGLIWDNGLKEISDKDIEAHYVRDKKGRLPLHCATQRSLAWKNGLREIYSQNPNAMLQADGFGYTPLSGVIEERFISLSDALYDTLSLSRKNSNAKK